MELKKHYIDGKWVESISGKTLDVTNPATGEVVAKVASGDCEDAKSAIAAAKKAFYKTGEWRRTSGVARADIMFKIADAIEARFDEFARTESIDVGKPLREAEGDVDDVIHCFRYYGGLITSPQGCVYEVSDVFGPVQSFTVHEPIGVCAQITPWNFPLLMASWKIAPALAAGNTIVFKPSSITPLSTILIFEVLDSVGLPPGTVNLVLGTGSAVGHELAESPDVDLISFTGSTATGQEISRAAAGNLKKVGLELGGKSPLIVFADADFEAAIEGAMFGIFYNQGEVCAAGSRLIVEKSIKDQFVARLVEKANAMTLGNGIDNPDMGPMVSEEQFHKVLSYIEKGKAEGAKLMCGGERYSEGACAGGYFIKPTIFDDCTPDMAIVQDEIFGPVLAVLSFETEEEAIALANDTVYGLAGGVFTTDGARALRVIKEIRAGITWINFFSPAYAQAPWGGYKMSGNGRELGVYGLGEYQGVKQINIHLQPGNSGWYAN